MENIARDLAPILIPMNHKPTNQEFKQIFDGIAERYNKVSNEYLVQKRKYILGNWAKGRCLEVGAGTGEISKFLRQKGHEVVATDIAPGMVQEIKKHGIEAYECDAEKLPFPDQSFDTVVAAEILFYLDNPDSFLSEAQRILRPNGQLLLSCASNFPVKFYDRVRSYLRAFGISGMYFKEDTLREFMTASKLRAMLARNGFDVLEEKKTPIFPIGMLDPLNTILEKTPLRHFGIFIFVSACKNTRAPF